jgi:enoyl-CoA hydratase/carnithine racemase
MSYAQLRPQHFLWRLDQDVGVVTLNRPERKNPLTFESYAELGELFRSLRSTHEVKALVVTGAGGNFCSGGDVHEIIGPLTRMSEAELLRFTRMTGDLVLQMRLCPQPIIAAIDGVCAGAGACVAMAADMRLGTSAARTAFLFARVGLAGCDMGACAILPRIIGQGRASELLYTARVMTAEEGASWGFFNRLVAAEELQAQALALAVDLARGPSLAHAMTKEMLHKEWSLAVEAAIEAEAQAQARCMRTADFHRAYEAFVAKARPTFKGD